MAQQCWVNMPYHAIPAIPYCGTGFPGNREKWKRRKADVKSNIKPGSRGWNFHYLSEPGPTFQYKHPLDLELLNHRSAVKAERSIPKRWKVRWLSVFIRSDQSSRVPAFVGTLSQKRAPKGAWKPFSTKRTRLWCLGNLGLLWARSSLGSFGGLASPPLTRTIGLPGPTTGWAMQWGPTYVPAATLLASDAADFLRQTTFHTQILIEFSITISGPYYRLLNVMKEKNWSQKKEQKAAK